MNDSIMPVVLMSLLKKTQPKQHRFREKNCAVLNIVTCMPGFECMRASILLMSRVWNM